MAKKKIDFDKYAAGLFSRTEQYADRVRRHYASAVDELLKLTAKSDLGESGAFSFGDDTKLSEKANAILRGLYSAVYGEIQNGVQAEWEFANLSCDALIESIFGKGLQESNHFARWFSRNKEAMDSFFTRKSAYGGLNLSQKVWRYTGDLKTEMECALTLSLGQGDSAATVSRRVRKYLQEPDRMFRRFRVKTGEKKIYDEEGNVIGTEPIYGRRWKRKVIDPQTGAVTWENFNPRDYHPGRGVYRSSYKNAMRLTRTETNIAYRSAEQDRWQRLDFVVGYEIKLSNNHPKPDICNDLKGKYPKDFVFKGWHPQCRCYVVPVLASLDEFVNMEKDILDGKEPNQPSGVVNNPPKEFYDWWNKNRERIESSTSMPYWVLDNEKVIYGGKPIPKWDYKKVLRSLSDDDVDEYCESIYYFLYPDKGAKERRAYFRSFENNRKLFDSLYDQLQKSGSDGYLSMIEPQYRELMSLLKVDGRLTVLIENGYIRGGYYKELNQLLRDGNLNKITGKGKEILDAMDSAISRSILPTDMLLNRNVGADFLSSHLGISTNLAASEKIALINKKIGSTITEKGFSSTSALYDRTAMSHGEVRIKILAQRGTHGYVSPNLTESEIILGRGQRFKIISAELADDGKIELTVKTVDKGKKIKSQEECARILRDWEERAKKNQNILTMAGNVSKVAKYYPEIDISKLEEYITSKQVGLADKEARNIAQHVLAAKKDEKLLSQLIPDVHGWKTQFSSAELHQVYDAVDAKIKASKGSTLEAWRDAMAYEAKWVKEHPKYTTSIVAQSAYEYQEKLAVEQIWWRDTQAKAANYQSVLGAMFKKDAETLATAITNQDRKTAEFFLKKFEKWDDVVKRADVIYAGVGSRHPELISELKSQIRKGHIKNATAELASLEKWNTSDYILEAARGIESPSAEIKALIADLESSFKSRDLARAESISAKLKTIAGISDPDDLEAYIAKHYTTEFTVHDQASYEHTMNMFGDSSEKPWTNSPVDARQAFVDYTGCSSGLILSDTGMGRPNAHAKLMDTILDQTAISEDVVLRSGQDYDVAGFVFGDEFRELLAKGNLDELNSRFRGTIGLNKAYMSTSFSKFGGFAKEFEFHIYAPKGTKMINASGFSCCDRLDRGVDWDGREFFSIWKDGGETEIILHRGLKYKFVKAEAGVGKGGTARIYIQIVGEER